LVDPVGTESSFSEACPKCNSPADIRAITPAVLNQGESRKRSQ
jgi:hypothetical protein